MNHSVPYYGWFFRTYQLDWAVDHVFHYSEELEENLITLLHMQKETVTCVFFDDALWHTHHCSNINFNFVYAYGCYKRSPQTVCGCCIWSPPLPHNRSPHYNFFTIIGMHGVEFKLAIFDLAAFKKYKYSPNCQIKTSPKFPPIIMVVWCQALKSVGGAAPSYTIALLTVFPWILLNHSSSASICSETCWNRLFLWSYYCLIVHTVKLA